MVLLVYSQHPQRHWELPGGKINYNETPREAALRELHEEAGLDAAKMKCLGCCVDMQQRYLMPIYIFVQENYCSLEPSGETRGAWYFPLRSDSLPKLSYEEDFDYYLWIAAQLTSHYQSN